MQISIRHICARLCPRVAVPGRLLQTASAVAVWAVFLSPLMHVAAHEVQCHDAVAAPLAGTEASIAVSEAADTTEHIDKAEIVAWRSGPAFRRTDFDSLALKENISVSLAEMLAYNSAVYVKQSGRATLSTISFRGTSASHTQVLWNGMRINSPMLGMTDFSLIPSFLVDNASLLHGTSSLSSVSGGLGGAVLLSTGKRPDPGFALQYVQGYGSFVTTDSFLRLSYGGTRFSSVTKAVVSSSRNDFRYVNRDRKENVYDDEKNIIGSYYPIERNRNGSWLDIHLLQEFRYDTDAGDIFTLSAWGLRSRRGLPMLTVDYGSPAGYVNEQKERALRAVASWRRSWERGTTAEVSAGGALTGLDYLYARDPGSGDMLRMTDTRSRTFTFFVRGHYSTDIGRKWHFSADIDAGHHSVSSEDRCIMTPAGNGLGYEASRTEVSASVALQWRPVRRLSASLSVAENLYGGRFSPPMPSAGIEYLLSDKGDVRLKASASRNYRFPTLNDLYFLPGGNPSLAPESGVSYDAGCSFDVEIVPDILSLEGEGSWFDSYIEDWILWLPEGAGKNYYTPVNMMKVHAYGIEQTLGAEWRPSKEWTVIARGSLTWSPSVNCGEPRSRWDDSVGSQLPYIPEFSASASVSVAFRTWSLLYKWCHYSKRFTMSGNEDTISGSLPAYFMSDVSVSKRCVFRWGEMAFSVAVRNLLDEEYMTVLSRPMPGINYEAFVSVTPKFGRGARR